MSYVKPRRRTSRRERLNAAQRKQRGQLRLWLRALPEIAERALPTTAFEASAARLWVSNSRKVIDATRRSLKWFDTPKRLRSALAPLIDPAVENVEAVEAAIRLFHDSSDFEVLPITEREGPLLTVSSGGRKPWGLYVDETIDPNSCFQVDSAAWFEASFAAALGKVPGISATPTKSGLTILSTPGPYHENDLFERLKKR